MRAAAASRSDARPGALALATVVAGHLLPLAGVFLWGWQVFDLLLIYWIESGVVGLVTVARILAWRPVGTAPWRQVAVKAAAALLFCVHYGLFWLLHGLVLVVLFGGPLGGPGGFLAGVPATAAAYLLVAPGILVARVDLYALAILGLLLAHGASVLMPTPGRSRLGQEDPEALTAQAYRWMLPLHLVIVAGGFLVSAVGQTLPVLVLFVGMKVAIEVGGYLWLRRKSSSPRRLGRPPAWRRTPPA